MKISFFGLTMLIVAIAYGQGPADKNNGNYWSLALNKHVKTYVFEGGKVLPEHIMQMDKPIHKNEVFKSALDTEQSLDSTLYYKWNSTTEEWDLNSKKNLPLIKERS